MMHSTTLQNKHTHSRNYASAANDPKHLLENLLVLDRMLVEVSMQLYNVNRRERSRMRQQNRRLHATVRKHLPRLINRYRKHE
jgi:hypothetical protein